MTGYKQLNLLYTSNNIIYHISLINTPGVLLFSRENLNVLYINNVIVWYHLRVDYYFYTYKQLYVINFLFFDNLCVAIVSRTT